MVSQCSVLYDAEHIVFVTNSIIQSVTNKEKTDIFIQSGVIDIFPKLKMAAVAILDLLGEP